MTEKKRCIRCQRPIDEVARICPYCNWDQSDLAAPDPQQNMEPAYVAPRERTWRRYALMAGGGIVLLIGSFALGSKIQGKKPVRGLEQAGERSVTSGSTSTARSRPAPRADVTLVPMSASDTMEVEPPITSAPATSTAEGVPPEYQRSDATAVSSVEYAQLAARAKEEKKKQKAVVDPRTITGPAYEQGSAPSRTHQPQMSSSAEPSQRQSESSRATDSTSSESRREPSREPARIIISTRPVPEYQPVPDVQVHETTVVRLQLTIGADGHVKEVNVLQGIPGQTSKIIGAVQTWRFRPATENGTPVSAPFTVDLSFRGQ